MRRRIPVLALPLDIKLDDILFAPDAEERKAYAWETHRRAALKRLERLRATWERQDLERARKRAKDLQALVEADRKFVAAENDRQERRVAAEQETKKIADYYLQEQRKELLARLARATKEISADVCRSERERLMRRGVVRGRK
jgi:hypothetical protein